MNFGNLKLKLKTWLWFCPENNYYPPVLETKFLASLLVLIFVLKALTMPLLFFASKTPFFAEITKFEIVKLTNLKRSLLGLAPLKENELLEKAAYLKAKDMVEKKYFAHRSPEGISPWYWFRKVGYDYQFAGENLAIGFLDSEEVINAWYQSLSHRENLLNPNYREMGVAVVTEKIGDTTTTLVVQLFGTKKEENSIQQTASPQVLKQGKTMVQKSEILPEQTTSVSEETSAATSEEKRIETQPEETTTKAIPAFLQAPPKTPKYHFVNFFMTKYSYAINFFNYFLIFLIIAYLALGIIFDLFVWRKYVLDYKDLIPKLGFFVFLFFVFTLLDKPFFLQIFPHDFKII